MTQALELFHWDPEVPLRRAQRWCVENSRPGSQLLASQWAHLAESGHPASSYGGWYALLDAHLTRAGTDRNQPRWKKHPSLAVSLLAAIRDVAEEPVSFSNNIVADLFDRIPPAGQSRIRDRWKLRRAQTFLNAVVLTFKTAQGNLDSIPHQEPTQ